MVATPATWATPVMPGKRGTGKEEENGGRREISDRAHPRYDLGSLEIMPESLAS